MYIDCLLFIKVFLWLTHVSLITFIILNLKKVEKIVQETSIYPLSRFTKYLILFQLLYSLPLSA